ncbi:MAG: glycosyltransferase [Aphanothece sp. CMT-3BRIN-NPC111]|jgi:glycosyltransferase involved in cell wall biosynthesis|nr:glycosyltransferase [Aphanothece sp. CMT-3BRIN-NPC111]
MPSVSVIITTYQRASLVTQAIKSVLAQSYKDYEIIVVNDGSTDNTAEVLNKFQDKIKIIHQNNKGLSFARNIAIQNSQGQYIAFLDDDDVWLPTKLEKQIALLEANNKIGLIYSDMSYFDEKEIFPETTAKKRPLPLARISWMLFPYPNLTPRPSSVVVRRETLDEIGLFDESLTACEDYDLWLRISEKWLVYYLDEPLTMYRLSDTNMSKNKERVLINSLQVQEKAIERHPDYRRLPVNLLERGYYKFYLDLARLYLNRSEGDKARQVIRRYRQARHLFSVQ